MSWLVLLLSSALGATSPSSATPAAPDSAARLRVGVEQLRASIGSWNVTTEFLDDSGKVARKITGTYRFEWVVPDRVISGRSDSPETQQSNGILFYVREKSQEIEMVSVGSDGRLWVMTGPIDEEWRTTPDIGTVGGGTMRLKFTRYAVTPDRFESKMEYSIDDGKTWIAGNHQVFRRAAVRE
jgi:hypothetical protein